MTEKRTEYRLAFSNLLQKYEKAIVGEPTVLGKTISKKLLPTHVYHYTNADGLLGIITTGEVWASSALYMNDTSEVTYGRGILHDALKLQQLKDSGNPSWKKVLEAGGVSRQFEALKCFCNLLQSEQGCSVAMVGVQHYRGL